MFSLVSFEQLTLEMEEKLSRSLFYQEIEFLKWVYKEYEREQTYIKLHK